MTRRLRSSAPKLLLRWLRPEEGTTSLEYALLMGIIVGAGWLVVQSLGDRLTSSYTVASAALAGPLGDDADHSQPSPAQIAELAVHAQRPPDLRQWNSQLIPLAMALAAVGLLIVQRRTARKQPAEAAGALGSSGHADQPAYLAKRQEILRTMAADVRSLLHNRLVVRNVMTTSIHTVAPAMAAAEVKQLMSERQVRHVLVCTPDRKLLGVISDRDLPVRSGATAAEVMTADAALVAPEVTVAAAVSIMLKRRISSLPVVDQERVVGIVTMTDVAMTLQCALQSLDKLATELQQHGAAPESTAGSIHPADDHSSVR